MLLDRVTFTGADDSVEPRRLVELSHLYPFIEWGILIGSRCGTPRFPSHQWTTALSDIVRGLHQDARPAISVHICGKHMRALVDGQTDELLDDEFGPLMRVASRIQLNFHGKDYGNPEQLMKGLHALQKPTIFQIDANKGASMLEECVKIHHGRGGSSPVDRYTIHPLFDASGGAGVVPITWPAQLSGFNYQGWAGGLGPQNVQLELLRISDVARCSASWIDMETHVRSDCDRLFDLGKVESVIRHIAPIIGWVFGLPTLFAVADFMHKSIEDRTVGGDLASGVGATIHAMQRFRSELSQIADMAEIVGAKPQGDDRTARACVRELLAMNDRQRQQIERHDDDRVQAIRDLKCVIMVYDATVALLRAVHGMDDVITRSQIKAAIDAHESVLREPSMIHFTDRTSLLTDEEK